MGLMVKEVFKYCIYVTYYDCCIIICTYIFLLTLYTCSLYSKL